MAIIYSYPKVTSPLATDVLVLTDTTLTAGKRKNKTKSLAMSDLAAYVVSSTSGITGGGTFNTIPLWTPDGLKLGDSIITQAASGQGVTVTGGLDVTEDLNVTGSTELFTTLEVQGASTFSDEVECNNNVTVQGLFSAVGSSEFLGNVSINEGLFDGDGSDGTAGQVLSSTGTQTEWVDPSAAITKLIPYFQLATPGGSDTYTQSNNIVDFDWSGGSGTYEYILPSATAIPYRKIRFVNNSTITASDKIRITAPGTETIDGGAFYEINKPYNGCAVWSDGVQWIVIQAKA